MLDDHRETDTNDVPVFRGADTRVVFISGVKNLAKLQFRSYANFENRDFPDEFLKKVLAFSHSHGIIKVAQYISPQIENLTLTIIRLRCNESPAVPSLHPEW